MAEREIWVMNARLAFADTIFEKKGIAGDPTSKARFGYSLILPPDDPQVAKLEALEEELCNEHEWKDKSKGADVLRALRKKGRSALKDGDDKKKYDGFEGNRYISANADTRPTAINRDRSPVAKEDGILYSGCYVNAKVKFWVQDNKWGHGLNVDALGVQFVKDGDSFASNSKPANPDDFPDLDAGDGEDDALFS